jgi:hypothetical protein
MHSRVIDLAIKNLHSNVKEKRERKIQKLRIRFGAIRIVHRLSEKLKMRNGLGNSIETRIVNGYMKPVIQIHSIGVHEAYIRRSKHIMK